VILRIALVLFTLSSRGEPSAKVESLQQEWRAFSKSGEPSAEAESLLPY